MSAPLECEPRASIKRSEPQAASPSFDLDGVLVDSEQVWDQARRDVVAAHGGTWKDSATRDMLGMSSPEWSATSSRSSAPQLTPEEVNAAVVEAMLAGYRERAAAAAGRARGRRADRRSATRSGSRPPPTGR